MVSGWGDGDEGGEGGKEDERDKGGEGGEVGTVGVGVGVEVLAVISLQACR